MKTVFENPAFTRRNALKLGVAGAGAALTSGLSSSAFAQAGAGVDQAIEWAGKNLSASTPEIIRGAAREGKLVLTLQAYGDDDATRGVIAGFRKRYPFITVDYTIQNAAVLIKKFSSELSAKVGVSDYVQLQSNMAETNKFFESGGIAQFVVSDDAAYPEESKVKGVWYPWLRQNGVTAYRTGSLKDDEKKLIRTYQGLGEPRFKGRLGIIAVTSSNGTTGSYWLMNHPDKTLWAKLAANKPIVKPSAGPLLDGLLAGEYDVAVMSAYPVNAVAAKNGAPVEFGISSPGPVVYAPGGISAIAPHPNAARLWQDWGMSKEGQNLYVSMMGAPSARNDADVPWPAKQPWFFEDRSQLSPIDWNDFSDKVPGVMDRFKKDLQTS